MRMSAYVLGLLLLAQLPSVLVTGLATWSKDCGTNQLSYLRSSDYELFYINGEAVDNVLFCQTLIDYHANGCFCNSGLGEWGRLGRGHCGMDLAASSNVECIRSAVEVPLRAGRKLLPQLTMNESIIHNVGGKNQSGDEHHQHAYSSVPKNLAMAIPGMFLLSCALVCPCFRARKKETAHTDLTKDPNSMDSVTPFDVNPTSDKIPASPFHIPPSPSRFSISPQLSRVGSVHLNVSQIMKATRSFSPALKIGEGGFGTVYRAQLQDGQVVAVKRAKKEHFDTLRTEFSSEIELLAKIEHRNLVRLLGYVEKGNERIIIIEYVPNGTLREHLDGQHGKILDFNQRLEIAIDVSHALTYLHLYAERPIIHRDVKSSNILLTESMRAKVADFGFARLGPLDADQTHISTKVKGTAGYLDPEYLKTYQLTPKSDVYSFGILLIEILTGRRPVELNKTADERVTVRWAFKMYNEGNMMDLLDPLMEEEIDGEVSSKMFSLAFQCAAPTRSDRPSMKEVGEQLWGIRSDYLRTARRG
eukprot:TRINITY_DN1510_c0_g2_i1.p1 TRINITY_DN1510_c0_g2~~TRINITY_DN1510_c0_g2_i1.p1  ORF type:complete len:531 (-),score=79.01 TRINITY_DN1510_c0_g2_i1:540-2132(-)